jgi:peptide/nickel transport system ATP-binding protein
LLAAVSPSAKAASVPVAVEETKAPLLQVEGLVAGYGGNNASGLPRVLALKGISFSISPGSVLGVIGESGSGKSTLARVLAGLLPAARGTVRLNGKELRPRLAERSREELRTIQIVFQMADVALSHGGGDSGAPAAVLSPAEWPGSDAAGTAVAGYGAAVAATGDTLSRRAVGWAKAARQLGAGAGADPSLILCDEVTSRSIQW